tara:strand:- start:152 stop:337 length:186 start_codon:yes stop_codon:yes gene_type:complete
MPWKVVKVPHKNCYKVVTIKTGKIRAKCTTKSKAKAQVRLLYSKEPSLRRKRKKVRRKKKY